MSRAKLPNRRGGVTSKFTHTIVSGKELHLLATFGFDDRGSVREIFSVSFKEGTDNQAVIVDACVALSRLLQHGDTAAELLKVLSSPPSLLGTLLREAIQIEKKYGADYDKRRDTPGDEESGCGAPVVPGPIQGPPSAAGGAVDLPGAERRDTVAQSEVASAGSRLPGSGRDGGPEDRRVVALPRRPGSAGDREPDSAVRERASDGDPGGGGSGGGVGVAGLQAEQIDGPVSAGEEGEV